MIKIKVKEKKKKLSMNINTKSEKVRAEGDALEIVNEISDIYVMLASQTLLRITRGDLNKAFGALDDVITVLKNNVERMMVDIVEKNKGGN